MQYIPFPARSMHLHFLDIFQEWWKWGTSGDWAPIPQILKNKRRSLCFYNLIIKLKRKKVEVKSSIRSGFIALYIFSLRLISGVFSCLGLLFSRLCLYSNNRNFRKYLSSDFGELLICFSMTSTHLICEVSSLCKFVPGSAKIQSNFPGLIVVSRYDTVI